MSPSPTKNAPCPTPLLARAGKLWLPVAAVWAIAAACLAGEPVPPGRRFLDLLGSATSSLRERRAAWEALKGSGQPPAPEVLRAIGRARTRAWGALERLLRTSRVREAASGLRAKVAPHQARVRSVVNGNAFSRAALDQATAPIQKALDEALAPLLTMDTLKTVAERINELEAYAADCGLRHGWDTGLGEALMRLVFVNLYAGTSRWRVVLERNRASGAWTDPQEEACIARLNIHRILVGLHPLRTDPRLVVAAKKHSEEMVAKGYFSHESPTPRWKSFTQRAAREHTRAGAECIAAGAASGTAAFRMWFYSQGHHKIMISGANNVGVGRCRNTWTLMVGNAPSGGTAPSRMAYYVRRRYQAGDSPGKLLTLAKWCAGVGLLEQAADELRRLLAIEGVNAEAQRALARLEAKGY